MDNVNKYTGFFFDVTPKNLEIEKEDELTVKLIEKKFKRKALKVHSDKTGSGDDEEFKELLNDYNRVIDAVIKLNEESKDDEATCLSKFFEKHNFAKECSQSWTIYVEKEKVVDWLKEMSKL